MRRPRAPEFEIASRRMPSGQASLALPSSSRDVPTHDNSQAVREHASEQMRDEPGFPLPRE